MDPFLSTDQITLAMVFSDSGINRLIFLESDNESEGGLERENWKESETMDSGFNAGKDFDCSTRFTESTSTLGTFMLYRYQDNAFSHISGWIVKNALIVPRGIFFYCTTWNLCDMCFRPWWCNTNGWRQFFGSDIFGKWCSSGAFILMHHVKIFFFFVVVVYIFICFKVILLSEIRG